jgi:hypothetical protein
MSDAPGPAPRDRRHITEVPLAEGDVMPETMTFGAIVGRLLAWPGSRLGRFDLARRLRRGDGLRPAEEAHARRLQTIAAARDVGAHAERYVDAADTITIDPPHRGYGRLQLLRALAGSQVRNLSSALTAASRATERVMVLQAVVERAAKRRAAREETMPARPAGWQVPGWLLLVLGIGIAAVEGAVTHPLWSDVLDDKRYGVVFAVVFAVVMTAVMHLLALWGWELANSYNRLREVTLAIVAAMVVLVVGLVIVSGFERDGVLIANRVQDANERQHGAAAVAAGSAQIAAAIPAGGTAATPSPGSTQPAAPAGGAGLLGAIVTAPGTGAATPATPPTTTAPATTNGMPSATAASASGLAGAVPGSTATPATAPAPAPTTTPTTSPAATSSGQASVDDVSYSFIIWLNGLVLLAVLLFTRSHALSADYRKASAELEDLQHEEDVARRSLGDAEEARQRAHVDHDFSERILQPLAERARAEEADLDALFVDQLQRSALTALGRPVQVRLATEPAELDELLLTVLPESLPTRTPAGVGLAAVPHDADAVMDTLAGPDRLRADDPVIAPFQSTRPAPEPKPETEPVPDTPGETEHSGAPKPQPETEPGPASAPTHEHVARDIIDGDPLDDEGVTPAPVPSVDIPLAYARDID